MRIIRVIAIAIFICLWLWAGLLLTAWPGAPAVLGWLLTPAWLGFGALAWRRRRDAGTPEVAGALMCAVFFSYSLIHPQQRRDWAPDQAIQASGTVEDGVLIVRGVRHCDAEGTAWETRAYPLADCRGVDLFIVPFGGIRGPAHVMVSFDFGDGEWLCVSIEARREVDEQYGAWTGMLRHFELIYIFGDERDVVARRLLIDRDPVWRYPLNASPDQARALLLDMVNRANLLAVQPEFYHSLANSCASNLRDHGDAILPAPIGHDWRVWLPGYAESLVAEHGLISAGARLGDFTDAEVLDASWSQRLRAQEVDDAGRGTDE